MTKHNEEVLVRALNLVGFCMATSVIAVAIGLFWAIEKHLI